jgi:hypothetical protein
MWGCTVFSIRTLSRSQAAAYHLALSATIALLVLAAMLLLWYPPSLFTTTGGNELILLLVCVDITLGPLITLIIFNATKRELPFDLAVIATLQTAALCYGIIAMHEGRPAFIVYANQHLIIVPASEIDSEELRFGSQDEFRHLSETGPLLVATQSPDNIEEQNSIAFLEISGFGIQHLPKYYVPYDRKRSEIIAASKSFTDLALTQTDRQQLDKFLRSYSLDARNALRVLPIQTRRGLFTAIIHSDTGSLIKVLPISPALR